MGLWMVVGSFWGLGFLGVYGGFFVGVLLGGLCAGKGREGVEWYGVVWCGIIVCCGWYVEVGR